jgi:hypothetical protein
VAGYRSKSHSWKKNKYKLDIVMSKANTEEKDIWIEEVNCCAIKNDIDCSYWEKLTMLQFIWVTMMGVTWGFAASAYRSLIQPQWNMMEYHCSFGNTSYGIRCPTSLDLQANRFFHRVEQSSDTSDLAISEGLYSSDA